MKIVREYIYEDFISEEEMIESTGREGSDWQKLKMIHNSKLKQDFDKFFELIPNLFLSKTDYIEDVEVDRSNDYEFIDEGSSEELAEYSRGIKIGHYKNCYSFLHEESGNAYYAKKEEVKETPEGRLIEVYKTKK